MFIILPLIGKDLDIVSEISYSTDIIRKGIYMSWGDGQYIDYCIKVKTQIQKAPKNEKESLMKRRWAYVRRHANIDRASFLRDICWYRE